ncbi:hypothetical protein QBC37DRAFT_78044 [Rhypophila decipiens]|uniref:Zn(2)-C6 fungal-type domain-containing protein n=1 Tax=Rhypophila decipiens TaxID=261697 RepID=A0AAN7BAU3_9PEZI|nr:hypothetical protein QBC37DRAFT_78044 [Rhypophila decipiens]
MGLIEESTQSQAPNGASQLRRILPAGPAPNGTSRAPRATHTLSLTRVPPKSVHVKAACETCRKRKIKCSGERPICASCGKTNAECIYVSAPAETHTQALKRKYDQSQDRNSAYEELYRLLHTLPENEAYGIFRRIRADGDIDKTVRHIKQGCLLLQLSMTPDTRLRYNFPYVPDMPPTLVSVDNPYLYSIFWNNPFAAILNRSPDDLESQSNCPYSRPYHAAEFFDPRLAQVRASAWTKVDVCDELFRDLLSSYFIYEYPTYYVFQKDYFLEDMVHERRRFCTPLLVNSVLALACHCNLRIVNREKFWDPQTLGYKFLAEARRLWEIEISEETKLSTIQAALLLSHKYSHDSGDKTAYTFVCQAVDLAKEMGIFKRETQVEIKSDEKMRNAQVYTAWSLYAWTSVASFYFFREPLIRDPPETPLPDPDANPTWYGEVLLRYPAVGTIVPMHHGHTFSAVVALRTILIDISFKAFSGTGRSHQVLTWEEANMFRRRLENLFESLPEALSPRRMVFPCHMKLHMEYHAAIYTIFTTLLRPDAESGYPDSPFSDDSLAVKSFSTAADIVSFAMNRFETITRIYYLRHCYDFPDLFMSYHLALLGNHALTQMHNDATLLSPSSESQKRRLLSTVFLCLKGLYEQGRGAYVCVMIYSVLLNKLNQRDRDLLFSELGLGTWPDENAADMAKRCRSIWPMPPTKRGEDPKKYPLDLLVKGTQEMKIRDTPKMKIQDILNAGGDSVRSSPEPQSR